MDFKKFQQAVAKQFATMSSSPLFTTNVSKEELYNTYLGSFPAGTNPIFLVRTEHDCSCCKSFIRTVGNVVTFKDGKLTSIWDCEVDDPAYQTVADSLADLVKSREVINFFYHDQKSVGVAQNFEQLVDGQRGWNHFHVNLPSHVILKASGPKLAEHRSNYDVFKRGLTELTQEALDTVLELIDQNSLYRGEEHRPSLLSFRNAFKEYHQLPEDQRECYLWTSHSANRFRNTVIGSLVVDLSNGVDLDEAVKMFESKVAPANYKRPTAVVTQAMVEKAKKTIEELGLTSALERRYANINDITINNVLFADRPAPADDVFGGISSEKIKSFDKVEEVPIEKFISDILPTIKSMEIMPDNTHIGNLVSLIAPVDPTARGMFKWNNNFSWSYNGEFADSIKERVKAAGGNVTGDVCIRLAWNNTDDLDLHVLEPDGYRIYFANRRRTTRCGGMLDLDANGADGMRTDPAENVFYQSSHIMKPGAYPVMVHQYSLRNSVNVGFDMEIEVQGVKYSFNYGQQVRQSQTIHVADIIKSGDGRVTVNENLPSSRASKDVWRIKTNTFVPVNLLMMSPNYWDGQGVGNKHYFFMLNGCRNEGKARGFFNEFLISDLEQHRKVIEMVGAKMKTEEAEQQLSGLGFSSTQRNSVICRIKGSFTRVIKLTF